jgi:hypothetical protein
MMNDRLSVQLRRHLLASANDRPADGQLAALAARVAVTGQRRPLVARLTGFPGRIGPIPTRALGYALIAAALLAATIAAALLVAGALQRPSTVFEGTWISIDPADRSTQTLAVGPGSTPTVHFQDHFATGDACVADTIKLFEADGTGAIDGHSLGVTWPDGGGCGSRTVAIGDGTYAYDEATDTIVDGQDLTWRRVQGAAPLPTRGPVIKPPVTPAPQSDCIQFDAPGRYTARAGSISLTVSVGNVGDQWIGFRHRFELLKAACEDGRGTGKILAAEVTRVYADACAGVSVPVSSATEAVAAMSGAKGLEVVGQTQVSLAGLGQATRLDMTVPDVPNSCPDGQIRVADGIDPFAPTLNVTLFLIDVHGRTLALAIYAYTDLLPAVTAQVDAIIASMQVVSYFPAESPQADIDQIDQILATVRIQP